MDFAAWPYFLVTLAITEDHLMMGVRQLPTNLLLFVDTVAMNHLITTMISKVIW